MGCCLCCCDLDGREPGYRTPLQRPSQFNRSDSRSFDQHYHAHTHGQPKTQLGDGLTCELCGKSFDPALLDGHRESCRANHLRSLLAKNAALLSVANLQPSTSNTRLHDDGMNPAEKELCVVCMDRPRCYAFLPCGHISCCEECTKALDQCPLCRQPREGLCYVSANVASQYECKHCRQLIAPTLFDGHREVCGLRQRQRQREAEEAAAAAAAAAAASASDQGEGNAVDVTEGVVVEGQVAGGDSARNTDVPAKPNSAPPPQKAEESAPGPARSHAHTCLECGQRFNQLMVCVPCGHRVLCYGCAQRRSTCPVCVSEIRDTVVAFD